MPRTNFNSSRLNRLLVDLSLVDDAESTPAFAERLGQWLDLADAITLHAAHGTADPLAAPHAVRSVASVAVEEEFVRRRSALADSIATSCSAKAGEARMKTPMPNPGAAIELAVPYEPYRRFYLAQQGDMELRVRSLRSEVRQALAQACPRLKQLATLDAAFDKMLGGRERQLLSTLPSLLEKRFAQLFAAHQAQADPRQFAEPVAWRHAGGWLARFCHELQAVLLAELDLRLQPTVGLIEALRGSINE